jgi:hypothetical protein
MSQAPWFKFYAADYMSSPFVQALDPEQELWYVRLIIASAISLPRGCLPLANGKLWRLAKATSEEYFEKNAGAILAKFERDEVAEVYRVPKVASQQLLTSSELSMKRSEAGKRGAANRWQSAICGDGKLPSETMANAKQNIADSDSDSDINPSSEQNSRSDQEDVSNEKKAATPPSREASRLTALLKSEILRNKADYRVTPKQERKWALVADRMLRLDHRKIEEVAEVIRWVQRDEFWMANVLSMDTLREKFDQLSLRAKAKTNGKSSAPVPLPADYVSPSKEILRERAAAVAQ